jgi:hypothetical protein
LGRCGEARDYLTGEIERFRQLRRVDDLRAEHGPSR